MKILPFFVNFRLNQIRKCSVQIKKMKDGIFSFQLKKNTSVKRQQTMLDVKMYPLPLIWLELWSHTTKWLMEENSRKNRSEFFFFTWRLWLGRNSCKYIASPPRRKVVSRHDEASKQVGVTTNAIAENDPAWRSNNFCWITRIF